MEVNEMNSGELEIYKAVRQAQGSPTIIRQLCLICKNYLNEWDMNARHAVCWKCRKAIWPKPKVEEISSGSKQPRLVQIRDGVYAIAVD
jgi:hypothetical protein